MQLLAAGESLDGGDLGALGGDGQSQARVDRAAVDEHRAGAALAVIAALLGPGQRQILAQRVEQRHAQVDAQAPVPTVDAQDHVGLGRGPGLGRRRRRVIAAAPAAPGHQGEPEAGHQAHHRPLAARDPRPRRRRQQLAPGRVERAGEARGQNAARRVGEAHDPVAVHDEHAIVAGGDAEARAQLLELTAQPGRGPGRQLDVVVRPERPHPGVRDDEQDRAEPPQLGPDRAGVAVGRPAAHEREDPRPSPGLGRGERAPAIPVQDEARSDVTGRDGPSQAVHADLRVR